MKSKTKTKRRVPKGFRKRKSRISRTARQKADVTFDEYEKKSAIIEGLYVPDGWL